MGECLSWKQPERMRLPCGTGAHIPCRILESDRLPVTGMIKVQPDPAGTMMR